jgi:hypothetical protein
MALTIGRGLSMTKMMCAHQLQQQLEGHPPAAIDHNDHRSTTPQPCHRNQRPCIDIYPNLPE